MIEIIVHSELEKLHITGIIELGCKACREAMKEGKGNPELCKSCAKNNTVILETK